ncbi:alpha/beta hydrolase [Paratractidigestivibacter sp.]|uniref:alpha/beta hydrolase n=1 Tax=Paratractidigestivibacter sp. TaxID=2847316 RepID=UPI002AC93922|nr:alpha/beta hydrolase [Paratractidigestivibacter sp.]
MRQVRITLNEETGARLEGWAIDPHISASEVRARPAMIVAPGGGYLNLAHREAEPVAARWLGMGYQVFILRYSVLLGAPEECVEPQPNLDARYPVQVGEAARAVAYVREHAEELGVDAERVFILGFSAGAHVAISLAERWQDFGEAARPRGVVGCYPMLRALDRGDDVLREYSALAVCGTKHPSDEQRAEVDLVEHANASMPPLFLWHTSEDGLVPPADTARFAARAMELGVPCELHIYREGHHGSGLCDQTTSAHGEHMNPHNATWAALADEWARGL